MDRPKYILDLCVISLYFSLANQISIHSLLLEHCHHLTLKRKYNCLTVWIQRACTIIFPFLHDHRCHCESKAQQALALSGLAEGGLCIGPTQWERAWRVFLSYSPSRDSFIHFLVWSLPAPTITITSENLKVFIQSQANSEFGLSTGNQGALVNGQYRMASKAFSLVQTSRDNPPSHWPPTSLWMPHCLIYHKDGRCW